MAENLRTTERAACLLLKERVDDGLSGPGPNVVEVITKSARSGRGTLLYSVEAEWRWPILTSSSVHGS